MITCTNARFHGRHIPAHHSTLGQVHECYQEGGLPSLEEEYAEELAENWVDPAEQDEN